MGIVFEQDGAPSRWATDVRDYLDDTFGNNWCGRRGPIVRLPNSPNLTPPDFFLWGFVKNDVHMCIQSGQRIFMISEQRFSQLLRLAPSLPSKETLRGHSDSSFRGEGYIQCCVGVRLCDMYSNQELAEIHFMYGKADGSAALARRLYQERYPQRQCPDRKTFVRLHYRLCEYGKFNSPGLGREGDDQDLQLQKYRRRFWRL
ncbi:hypothetical protein ANN_26955 [Periplaneta americana]|uniref:DUF4817 domain-containing protein n=1 Tax=Periplaneta americana TaxID=6978 RepID=A0ABQ8RWP5_PERAM|nr:hypothetical protein ANN_26955 [Periplaneta americana]